MLAKNEGQKMGYLQGKSNRCRIKMEKDRKEED